MSHGEAARLLSAATLALLGAAASLSGQEISGRVAQRDNLEPVSSAIVELVNDSTRQVASRTLTGPDGLFRLAAPTEGRYHLRVERIGLATVSTDAFVLTTGERRIREIVVAAEPVSLAALNITSGRRCSIERSAPFPVQQLWDEARKTLTSVALLENAWLATFRVLLWERDLDPGTGRIRSEELSERTILQTQPFVSRPPLDLIRNGFIRRENATTTYHVPDASVLLSDEFLETYCFRSASRGSRIGLVFEPYGSATGIRGTLWLDRQSGALEELEYEYTNAPAGGRDWVAGGAVEFAQVENGAAIVSRWYVRMPRFALVDGRETAEIALVHESGGQVLSSELRGRPRGIAVPTVTVSGTLLSAEGEPLPGAFVYVAGTSRSARTDAAGSFVLPVMLPGHHTISWTRDADRSGERAGIVELEVSGSDTTIVLQETAHLAYFDESCGRHGRAAGSGSVLGRVFNGTLPVPFATVTTRDPSGRVTETVADAAGRFTICDVRGDVRIEVTRGTRTAVRHVALHENEVARLAIRLPASEHAVTMDTVMTDAVRVRMAADSLAEVEARRSSTLARALDRIPAADGPGRVLGVVLSEASQKPLAGARVVDEQSGIDVVTDARGAFRFQTTASILSLQVSHVGFETVHDTIRIRPGEVAQLEIRLGVMSLEPIVVSARRRGLLADAYWRRASQTGTFLDARVIRRRAPRVVTDMLRDQNGIHVITEGSGMVNGRIYFRNLCAPAVYLDGIEVTRVSSRRSDQAMRETFDELNRLHPSSIELIEIYRGPSEVPGEFAGAGAMCGAIAIWSRRGTDTN